MKVILCAVYLLEVPCSILGPNDIYFRNYVLTLAFIQELSRTCLVSNTKVTWEVLVSKEHI
jgi:hypothetical protein